MIKDIFESYKYIESNYKIENNKNLNNYWVKFLNFTRLLFVLLSYFSVITTTWILLAYIYFILGFYSYIKLHNKLLKLLKYNQNNLKFSEYIVFFIIYWAQGLNIFIIDSFNIFNKYLIEKINNTNKNNEKYKNNK